YTHKEIFLREIISNASDAIDKLCYLSLTDDKVGKNRSDFFIQITADKDKRTLTVSDNGIGMDQSELENNLGVIAASGSYQFRQEAGESEDVDIIGQFGVGFYSAFMVADEITVVTRKYGSDKAYEWKSAGVDGYTVSECEKAEVGTDIIMHLKADTEDEKYGEYLETYRLRELIKKYSDYIRYPIRMLMPTSRVKEGSDPEKPEYETVEEMTTVNSMVPLWQRKRSEVTEEEYAKFYSELTRDYEKPLRTITVSVEGNVTYKALMFVPGTKPMNFNTEAFEKGLQLYSAGVMIMDKCDALLPDYLRFVRGVVDSPDLSLNISRELLQHDRQLKVIAKNLEKKIIADLEKFLKEDREGYEKFYGNYARAIGYGVAGEGGESRRDELKDLLLFYSSTEKKLTTLREYVDRMPESQKNIYYAAGESVALIDALPQTELLKDKNYEVLYLTGEADEFVLQTLQNYADKPFRSIVDGDLDLGEGDKQDVDEKTELMQFVKETLGDKVKEVKASHRLKTHPACMSAGQGLSFEMEKYFKNFDMPQPIHADRILELNTAHPSVLAMEEALKTDRDRAALYAKILYNQSLLIAGLPLDNPGEYTDMIAQLMK
ncbi:MAG: molecular chaperone HtpG, partial [Oscillospiraceae bacterium]|nr:molecular chaperone HtpG [Oscillospiraceae bacterium]